MAETDLAQLITDVKESLERALQSVRHEIRDGFAQVNARLDTQAMLMERELTESSALLEKLERRNNH